MHRREGKLIVSATDLVGFLACGHLTHLERAAVANHVRKPDRSEDPEVALLQRRGGEHEKRYIELLEAAGRTVTNLRSERIEGQPSQPYEERAAETIEAMRRGDDVIYQATVFGQAGSFDGHWVGHPDFLLRVDHGRGDARSALGDYHYEVADTKLAHTAKPSALIQICSYVEQIERIQGVTPKHVHVVTGGAEAKPHTFLTAEMMAFYRRVKAEFERAIDEAIVGPALYPLPRDLSYPDPVDHCQVCRWYPRHCLATWRQDDALPLVAGISRRQRATLTQNSVATMRALSELGQPIEFPGLRRGQAESLWKVREQARLQVASAGRKPPVYELLPPDRDSADAIVPNRGLTALPPPTGHDLFFDIEGDPFAFWEGLDYLFGVWEPAAGDGGWHSFWALDRREEKAAFERVIGLFVDRCQRNPDMHVYHYGVYETSHLKQLAGRHATCQAELDDLLRAGVFVDLYRVVRQGVIVGTEGYSIKDLEPLYEFDREIDLRTAGESIVEFELWLDLWLREGRSDRRLLEQIELYNRDDCRSTERLRDWLERLRIEAASKLDAELPRPRHEPEPTKPPTDWEERLAPVVQSLTDGLPSDPAAKDATEQATWLLASLLDWHRREEKASWWRFFELLTLSDDELFEEQEPIGGLRPEGVVGETRSGKLLHRYRFVAQEHKVGNRSDLHDPTLPPFGAGHLGKGTIDKDRLTLDIALAPEWNGPDPTSIVPHDRIPIEGLQSALLRVGQWVIDNGIHSPAEEYRAVRDLVCGSPPRIVGVEMGTPLKGEHETGSEAARRLARLLDGTTLAVQGPPGSGKTYSGARMILDLIRDRGRRVGITGSSHKVVTNLLQAVWDAAREDGFEFGALQKVDADDAEQRPWTTVKDNGPLDRLLAKEDGDFRVIAGTVWLWARDKMAGSVDTLFVDEAGQVALANVVAAGGAARNIVLLGDPQQLDQVLQGSHPPGAEKSALGHYLGEAEVVAPDRGLFLEQTWRMHPAITTFTSTLFYESELTSRHGLQQQRVLGGDWLAGSGIRWVEVAHDGNTNASVEEIAKVVGIVEALIGREWVNQDGKHATIGQDDILIVSPFNAHRLLLEAELEKVGCAAVGVGTVDKFQGQEAAVSIYTMATSRPEDAPRGVDFLYSLHRLNVATSRARALAIVVGSPALLTAVPKTPEQLRMVNALCAFVEHATGQSA